MTRCCRDNVNLKSSVYNQTGESCVDQLSLHRSMCTHYRRVLLAKSVVDSRNPRYTRIMQKRCRPSSCKLRFFEGCPSNETIDKLAYDTEHHPSEIIKVQYRSKSSSKERSCSREKQPTTNDANCPCLRLNSSKERLNGTKSNLKNQKRSENVHNCRQQRRAKKINYAKQQFCNSKCGNSTCCSGRSRKCNYEATADQHRVTGCNESSSERSCRITSPVTGETSHRRCSPERETFRKLAVREEDEARYAKFVYDITQEIVQNGLYTDRELKEVFEKHLERNSGRLNKRKMLYEIYQLKISLNMMDDSEDEDEIEADLVYAEKFSNLRVPKPPTPPKILNENKVLEKLESFKHQQENGDLNLNSYPGSKNVVLIDANPEFLVTERDVLSTLMDNDVDPTQIQRIYRNLYQKSRDMSLCEAVQVGKEVAYTHRLKQVDKSSSAISLNCVYSRDRSHGILRKESTDFSKPLSPDLSYHRYNYIKNRQNEALEKCAKWRMGLCECKTQPCKQHMDAAEQEKTENSNKISIHEDKSEKEDYYGNKKINFAEKAGAERKIEKLKSPKYSKSNKGVKHSSDASEYSSIPEILIGDKQDSMSKTDISTGRKSYQSEENEEIEEEIESVIDELPEKSSRKSSITEIDDKSDDEEKEQSSIQEEKRDEDGSDSDDSENSDESEKYSDNASVVSESSEKNTSARSRVDEESKISTPKDKVSNRRYSSMQDWIERFEKVEEQNTRTVKVDSSDSSSTTTTSTDENATRVKYPVVGSTKPSSNVSRVIKKRTSSGLSGYKVMNTRNERLSGLSSDFYVNSTSKICDSNCRGSSDVKKRHL